MIGIGVDSESDSQTGGSGADSTCDPSLIRQLRWAMCRRASPLTLSARGRILATMLKGVVTLSGVFVAGIAVAALQKSDLDCQNTVCDIALTKVVALKDNAPRRLGDYSVFVLRDRSGRFFAATRDRRGIVVFSPTGSIQTTLEHPDFQRIQAVPGVGESILIHDYQRHELRTVSRDLAVGSALALRFAPAFATTKGHFIVAQQMRTPEHVGYPLHLVDAHGRIVRSFGIDSPKFHGGMHRVDNRVVSPASDGSVWAAAPGRYVLERWDPVSGVRLARLQVQSKWFVESSNAPDERLAPTPLIEALWEKDGVLFVLARVSDADWKAPAHPNTERSFNLDEYERTYDWVVEAVAPDSGRVLAHRRLATAHWTRPASGLLVSRASRSDGTTVAFDVWTAQLSRK